jgi:hypothetical protein
MAAGAGIGVAAGVGTAVVSATRSKLFLERVNKEYFGPRGLKASIVKDSQLAAKLGVSARSDPLGVIDGEYSSLRDRRMRVLSPYLSPLTLNVPPPSGQERNILDKISARQIRSRIDKSEKKQLEKHEKSFTKAQEREEKDHRKQLKQADKEVKRLNKKLKKHKHAGFQQEGTDEEKQYEDDNQARHGRRKKSQYGNVENENEDEFGELVHNGKVLEKERKKIAKMEYLFIDAL